MNKLSFVLNESTKNTSLPINMVSDGVNINANNSAKFTKSLLEKTLKHLLGYCYFKLGNTIFRQVIGVAMGSDPNFFIANLLLYHNKNTSIRRIKIKKI